MFGSSSFGMELFLTADLWEGALARDRLGCQPDNTGVPLVPFARWKRPYMDPSR